MAVLSYLGYLISPDGLKLGKQILGTNRLFGLLGRMNLVTGAALLAWDALQIGLCVDDCLNEPDDQITCELQESYDAF